MPILHRCGFPSCTTPTINAYCYFHGRFVRDELEAERGQVARQGPNASREDSHSLREATPRICHQRLPLVLRPEEAGPWPTS
jgi:hypothetical protein